MPITKHRGLRQRKKKSLSVADLVDEIESGYGIARQIREHKLVTGWHEIVGERVAARASPDGLSRGVLSVRVSNSAWMHELSFLREAIVQKANEVCGGGSIVRSVRLHLGRKWGDDPDDVVAAFVRRPAAKKPVPRKEADSATKRRIDEETATVADPELRAALRVLRKRLGV